MPDYTSLIPGNSPVPEPSGPRYLGVAVSVLLCLAFTTLIVFILYEFTMDMAGKPVEFQPGARTGMEEVIGEENLPEVAFFDSMAYFRLLSPLPNSALESDKVTVLCTWKAPTRSATMPLASMRLWIDDVAVPWRVQFGSNTWLADFKLEPGVHRLRTPVFEEKFYVMGADAGLEAPPEGWKRFSMHENINDEKQCGNCHYWIDRPEDLERVGHGLTIGSWKGANSCVSCHSAEDLQRKHLHTLSVYEDCSLCHVIHGTTESEKPLLKAPKSRLCVLCHEAP